MPPAAIDVIRLLRPRIWRESRPVAPVRDYVRLLRIVESAGDGPGEAVPVRIRPLGGRVVWLRKGTTDARVMFDAINGGYHLPPPGLQPLAIFDLGANIGITALSYALRFPDAEITAVELAGSSASLARRNTAEFADRCHVLEGAVWVEDGEVAFVAEPGREFGARIDADGTANVRAFSINTLLADREHVDYVKLDIEGAELRVLREHTEWSAKVRCVKVEVHTPYTADDCRRDLVALGYTTTLDRELWVIGRR